MDVAEVHEERKSRSRSIGGSASEPRITKTTPIKATTFRSPVIVKQAQLGSRTKLYTRVVAGYLVTRYHSSKCSPSIPRRISSPRELCIHS